MNQLDQVFREKLEGHTMTPSAEAWTKIEARLQPKSRFVWVRYAAVLALAASAAGWWYSAQTPEQPEQVAAAVQPVVKPLEQPHSDPVVAALTPAKPKKQVVRQQPVVTTPVVVQQEELQEETLTKSTIASETTEVTAIETEVADAKPVKPIVLVYVLEPVQSTGTTETASVKKEKTLFKVMDLARNVKNGESGISDLKEASLELFATDHHRKSSSKIND